MPAPGRAQQALARQKEARQKKLLLALAPVLLVLLAWQGPGMVKAFTEGDDPPVPEASSETTTAAGDDAGTDAAVPTGPGEEGSAASGTVLPESDEPSEPTQGQLVAFDRFVGKDPFRQQVAVTATTPTEAVGSDGGDPAHQAESGGAPPSDGGTTTMPPDTADGGEGEGDSDAPSTTVLVSATVDVNGTPEVVELDAAFPATDPIFKLVSLTARSAKLALVSGEFETGAKTITLTLGKPVTLLSQPDGLRYTITLVSVP
jgi:hypothetical protein